MNIRLLMLLTVLGFSVACNDTAKRTDKVRFDAAAPVVQIDGGNTFIQLSWNPVPGASTYAIYWSQSADLDIDHAAVITLRENHYTHIGLENGVAYYYIVVAYDTHGLAGAASAVVSTVPRVPPDAAPLVRVKPGGNQVTLRWDAVERAEFYHVYLAGTPGVDPENVATLLDGRVYKRVQSGFKPKDLVNNKTYYFVVTAANSGGAGPPSEEINAVPMPAPVLSTPPIYLDVNKDAVINRGDVLVLAFDRDITVNAPSAADFYLPMLQDRFGLNPQFSHIGAPNQLFIELGDGASLQTRLAYQARDGDRLAGASGLDISETMSDGVIFGDNTIDAQSSAVQDIIPGFVVDASVDSRSSPPTVLASATGDIDRDGDIDVVLGHDANNQNSVWLYNKTTRKFDAGPVFGSVQNRTVGLLLADFDRDGALDALAVNDNAANAVYFNDNNGVFGNENSLGEPASAAAVGDFNTDGYPDIVLASSAPLSVAKIWLNDKKRGFSPGKALSPAVSFAIAAEDVDRDGDTDIIESFANKPGVMATLWRNQNGDFSAAMNFSSTAGTPADVRDCDLADVDSDGGLDVMFARGDNAPNELWLNDGKGAFVKSEQVFPAALTRKIALFDFDADGDVDLFEGNSVDKVQNLNRIWLNNGTGKFSDSSMSYSDSADINALSFADFNQDGDMDILENGILLHNSLAGSYGQFGFRAVAANSDDTTVLAKKLVDIDRDSDLDMFVFHNTAMRHELFLNDGFANLVNANVAFDNKGPWQAMQAADIDRNGVPDLLIASANEGVRIVEQTGPLVFTDKNIIPAETITAMATGDLDRDGFPDMVGAVAPTGGNSAGRIWRNDRSGIFNQLPTAFDTKNVRAHSLRLADVDGDDRLDLLLAGQDGPSQVFLMQPSLTDPETIQFATGIDFDPAPSSMIVNGDVDRDGDVDLLAINGPGNGASIKLWRNSPAAGESFALAATGETIAADNATYAELADLNGDGFPDLIANGEKTLSVLLNDRSGHFFTAIALPKGSTSLAVGDLDRDGDPDIAADGAFWINESDKQGTRELNFNIYVQSVHPVLQQSCANAGCHAVYNGAGDFRIHPDAASGSQEMLFSFFVVQAYTDPRNPAGSKLLQEPLAATVNVHAGGDIFPDTDHVDYQAILNWIVSGP